MKFALLALAAIFFASCTNTLYSHRKADFSPLQAKGPWTDYYQTVRNGGDPADPDKRPLFGQRD